MRSLFLGALACASALSVVLGASDPAETTTTAPAHAKDAAADIELPPVREMTDAERLEDIKARLAAAETAQTTYVAAAQRANDALADATRALKPHWEARGGNGTAIRADVFAYARTRTRAVVAERAAEWHTGRAAVRTARAPAWAALAATHAEKVEHHLTSAEARTAWSSFQDAVTAAAAARHLSRLRGRAVKNLKQRIEGVSGRISNAEVRKAKRDKRNQADRAAAKDVAKAEGTAQGAADAAKKAAAEEVTKAEAEAGEM
eukprot:TRINITY_DN2001_c0_g1_i1.p2 TRINITY_DN2001_c0_g1~~TRINITY_DN2001_c0_g1_i1.p2  ORF type:complete len:262 (-),score=148.98 TRINITY_DN2001_c0_g1_i1:130-915(-)